MKLHSLISTAFLAMSSAEIAEILHTKSAAWTVGQTVQTTSGPVSGHAASNETEVSEYLGIPFAAPPIGNLRFAPPQRYSGTVPINGTNYVRFYHSDSLYFKNAKQLKMLTMNPESVVSSCTESGIQRLGISS